MVEILSYLTRSYVLSAPNCCLHVYNILSRQILRKAIITSFNFLYLKSCWHWQTEVMIKLIFSPIHPIFVLLCPRCWDTVKNKSQIPRNQKHTSGNNNRHTWNKGVKEACLRKDRKTSQEIGRWCLLGWGNHRNKGPERVIRFHGLEEEQGSRHRLSRLSGDEGSGKAVTLDHLSSAPAEAS